MRIVGALLVLLLPLMGHPASAQSDREGALEHQSVQRSYVLHLPPNSPDGGPRPLVLALHGLDDRGDSRRALAFRKWWTMDAVADREGFVVAYPEAVAGRWNYGSGRPTPMPGREEAADDIGFLLALVDRLVEDGVADKARVFVTGLSRGGLMGWTLACAAPERFVAVAPLITPMTDHQLSTCHPRRLVPILELAGTADMTQPYKGWLYSDLGIRTASMAETMEFWRRLHGCTGQDWHDLPHHKDTGPTRVALITWTGCTAGGALQLLRVDGGGHALPTLAPDTAPRLNRILNHDVETAEEVWRFFAAGSLPTSAKP